MKEPANKLCGRCHIRLAVKSEKKTKTKRGWRSEWITGRLCGECFLIVLEAYKPELAAEARESGIAASYEAASTEWKAAVEIVIVELAVEWDVFSADDVWSEFELQQPELSEVAHEIANPSALGGVVRGLLDEIIQHTGEIIQSKRTVAHRALKRVYRSLLRPGAAGVTHAQFHPEDIVTGYESGTVGDEVDE